MVDLKSEGSWPYMPVIFVLILKPIYCLKIIRKLVVGKV